MRVTIPLILACVALSLPAHDWIGAPNVVVPASRVFHAPAADRPVEIVRVEAAIEIRDRVARTVLDVHLRNPSSRPQEAELCMPVPDGCTVIGLDFAGAGAGPSAHLLPRAEAKGIYEAIVRTMRDPALMEFAGSNLVRSSVFPVPPGGSQRLRLIWEQLLDQDGARIDYWLPRSEQVAGGVPLHVTATIIQAAGIASVWSPTHAITVSGGGKPVAGPAVARLGLTAGAERTPGAFRLSILAAGTPAAASVVLFPDGKRGGGYFLLLAGAPAVAAVDQPHRRRDVTVVLDRSGSMNGDKISQARAAAKQIIAGLAAGETFNVVLYHHGIDRFAAGPVAKSPASEAAARAWLDAMTARGGTNIADALHEALRVPAPADALPLAIVLSDGVATVGTTGEAAIRALARSENVARRRLFTVGVGLDVNTHLLEKLADDSRATAVFLRPGEDIELPVATLFERLRGPVVTDLALSALAADGTPAHGRLIDVSPGTLGDLFQGQQVLITGRYVGAAPLTLVLAGKAAGATGLVDHRIAVRLDPARASTAHGHVPRLWATRRIGELVDAVRSLGATPAAGDARFRELVDEIVRLSTEFGVLTEYTAFLAEEGSRLDLPTATAAADVELRRRAIGERSGSGSWAQSFNGAARKNADKGNLDNRQLDAAGNEQSYLTCQPQSARAYWKRGERWVDSGALTTGGSAGRVPDREIAFASADYFALADRLARDHRQAALANAGEVLLEVDGSLVLVRNR